MQINFPPPPFQLLPSNAEGLKQAEINNSSLAKKM